jgi:hypothetical protein
MGTSLIPDHPKVGCRLELSLLAGKVTILRGFVKREKGKPSLLGNEVTLITERVF